MVGDGVNDAIAQWIAPMEQLNPIVFHKFSRATCPLRIQNKAIEASIEHLGGLFFSLNTTFIPNVTI